MRFGRLHTVVRNTPGGYVDGVWVPGTGVTSQVKLDIQPATSAQFKMMESLAEGRRVNQILAAFAEIGTNLKVPEAQTDEGGDWVIVDGVTFLVIAKASFTSLGTARATSHELYLIEKKIEAVVGETLP